MSLHKDPWVMQRVNQALDAILYSEHQGLETALDLLAFAEDILEHFDNDVWRADKRATALAGAITRSEAHLREALGYEPDQSDAGLESLAVQVKYKAKEVECSGDY